MANIDISKAAGMNHFINILPVCRSGNQRLGERGGARVGGARYDDMYKALHQLSI